MMTTIITWVSLLVIAGVYAYFQYQAHKIKMCYKELYEVLKSEDIVSSLKDSKYRSLVESYMSKCTIDVNGSKKTNIPAEIYLNEVSVCRNLNLNLRMLDIASGTLVGLGLWGTFLGLTIGIAGFDSTTTAHIQESIQSLLGGMGTAFYTSLFGMAFSLLYGAFEKSWKNRLNKNISDLNDKLDEMYYIDDLSLVQLRQEAILKATEQDLFSKLEGLLTYTNTNGQKVFVANSIREILKENEEQSKALKSFSTDLALELNNGFDDVLSRQMQAKILPLMENVDNTTKSIVEHIDLMASNVASPATDMIQVVIEELKRSMTTMMSEFKTSLSGNTTAQLEGLASTMGVAAQSMIEFPKNMENISATLQVTIEEVKSAISEISSTSASSNSRAMRQMQEQITFATTSISNAITEVKEVMSAITHSSAESSNEVMNRLSATTAQISNFMNDSMAQMSASMQESLKEVLSGVSSSLTDVTKAIGSITQTSEQSNQQVMNQLSNTSKMVGDALQSTMTDMASSVETSMKGIAEDVVNKQSDLLALQESTMDETRKLLVIFNNGLNRLESINEAVGGTMSTFQAAQGEISGTTSNLRMITSDMKTATEVFHKSQNDYTGSITTLQQQSQKNIDTMSSLLMDSGEMLKDYVEKFETIRNGLSQIFTQIQSGLNEYSRTVKKSLEDYLGSYTENLTKTTEALSNTIQQQSDVVEMLVESMNKKK